MTICFPSGDQLLIAINTVALATMFVLAAPAAYRLYLDRREERKRERLDAIEARWSEESC
jgi:hypothetical protein